MAAHDPQPQDTRHGAYLGVAACALRGPASFPAAAPGPIAGVAQQTAPRTPNPKKRRRGASYNKDKSKRVKAELLDVYFAGNTADRLCSTGRLDEIAANLAGSDFAEIAANQADRESKTFRSSYQNMVENIYSNEFRKAGTTLRPGARTTGAKKTASARGFAKFLVPLTSL